MPRSNVYKQAVPLDCPVCKFMLRDLEDAESYLKNGCCIDCFISFIGPTRSLKGDDTYLPSGESLKKWRDKVKQHNNLIKQG